MKIKIIAFIIVPILVLVAALAVAVLQPEDDPILSDKTKLAICQRKAFTTAEGIILAPYGKKIKGQPNNLWVVSYLNGNMKLEIKEGQ